MRNKTCLYYIIVALLCQIVIAGLIYFVGRSRGRDTIVTAQLTAEAARYAVLAATFTHTPTLVSTGTETGTPLPTSTLTNTPLPSPTRTPTTTASPASPQERAERFYNVAIEGLNTIDGLAFSPNRAATLLRNVTQNQGLISVPASYVELQTRPWAALIIPQTEEGRTIPALFWREPSAGNQILGQLLYNDYTESKTDKAPLLAGVDTSLWRTNAQGLTHLLLVEKSGTNQALDTYLFVQTQPASNFELMWRSDHMPLWSVQSADSQYTLVENEQQLLPDIEISAPMLSQDNELRNYLDAPALFIEQQPFARQWSTTRWTPILGSEQEGSTEVQPPSALVGYRLDNARLHPTPLTALSQMLKHLQADDVGEASKYATRFDLLQTAFDMGLGKPTAWVALYVDGAEQELLDNVVTAQIRFFDNADRSHTYDAFFEEDDEGNYRVASLSPAPIHNRTDIITPIPVMLDPVTPPASVEESSVLVPTPKSESTLATFPTPKPTLTATAKPTETATTIPTATPSPTPGTVPYIPSTEEAPTTGTVAVDGPTRARLRGGPGVEFDSLDGLNNGTQVEVFGITEVRNWVLARTQEGKLGWISADLILFREDVSTLLDIVPSYRADGRPVIPPTAMPTSDSALAARSTPVISLPVQENVSLGTVPDPASGDRVMTLGGQDLPPDPLQLLPAISSDNTELQLDLSSATVEIWRGIFDSGATGWVAAPAELLWPGTQVYLQGKIESGALDQLQVSTIRIVKPPSQARTALFEKPLLAKSVNENSEIAFLGSRERSGIYLLDAEGTVQQLWKDEEEIEWINGDNQAGLLLQTQEQSNGRNGFSWVRTDGTGLTIFAQPLYNFHGVAGDAHGGLWWIETPQVAGGTGDNSLDIWQLWHYDPSTSRIIKRFQASGTLFNTPEHSAASSLVPQLLAVSPQFSEEDDGALISISLLVDTLDRRQQKLYTGLFRFALGLEQADSAADVDATLGTIIGGPQLLLSSETYRGPLKVSPDRSQLAYLVYDQNHPSLISGFIRPANTLQVLQLTGPETGTTQTLYQSENQFEFLAPNLAWQGNHRLLLARGRFADGNVFGVDRFGIVQVQLPVVDGSNTGSDSAEKDVILSNYLLTEESELMDFATCRDGAATLFVERNATDEITLVRWDNLRGPVPVFGMPPELTRSFICWQSP